LTKFYAIWYLFVCTVLSAAVPLGDSETLPGLWHTYRLCCAEEGESLDIIEFLTDHLLQMDDDADAEPGSHEKPHIPALFAQAPHTVMAICPDICIKPKIYFGSYAPMQDFYKVAYTYQYICTIHVPPDYIAA
jgi:hypothetical protein